MKKEIFVKKVLARLKKSLDENDQRVFDMLIKSPSDKLHYTSDYSDWTPEDHAELSKIHKNNYEIRGFHQLLSDVKSGKDINEEQFKGYPHKAEAWKHAADFFKKIGETEKYEAIMKIFKAVQKGDKYLPRVPYTKHEDKGL